MDASARGHFWRRLSPSTWLLIGLLLVFALLSVQHAVKASRGDGAILRWRDQLLELQDGDDIYTRHNYPNPPIMAIVLLPFAELPDTLGVPPLATALAWFWVKVGLTLVALFWLFRMVEAPGRPFPLWAKVLAVLLTLRPIAGDLSHGNVNLFILFLVVAGLHCFHSRRDFLAGLLIALAAACKVTPAIFIPYFVWKRAWKAVAGSVVGLALFFWPGFVPALYLGWDENQEHVRNWLKVMVNPYVVEGQVWSEHNNQSVPGFVYRMLTDSPSFSTYVNDEYTPLRWHNVAALPIDAARWIIKGLMGLFALLVVWLCRTPRPPCRVGGVSGTHPGQEWWVAKTPPTLHMDIATRPGLVAEYAIIALGMLLFSERTWKHHCVVLMIPFVVLSYYLALFWPRKGIRAGIIAALAAVMLLMTTTSTSLLGREGGKLAQVYGAYVAAFVILLSALAVMLRCDSGVPAVQLGDGGKNKDEAEARSSPRRLAG